MNWFKIAQLDQKLMDRGVDEQTIDWVINVPD